MAVGWSTAAANAALDELINATTGHTFVQLHIGDPGAAGTANPAVETDRQDATYGAAAAGSVTTTADLEWLNVAGSETYTHFSAWDAVTAGNFGFSGTVTANAVTATDDFKILAGDLTVSLDLAA